MRHDAVTNDFWSQCLSEFEKELPAQQFNSWIKSLRIDLDTAGHYRLLAPNRFVLQWVRERYFPRIEALLQELHPDLGGITLSLDDKTPSTAEALIIPSQDENPPVEEVAAVPVILARNIDPIYDKTRLNPDFTFETLVTGRSNDLARAAAQQVALNPGVSYNPLFVYGGVGLGKTHLVHALGN